MEYRYLSQATIFIKKGLYVRVKAEVIRTILCCDEYLKWKESLRGLAYSGLDNEAIYNLWLHLAAER